MKFKLWFDHVPLLTAVPAVFLVAVIVTVGSDLSTFVIFIVECVYTLPAISLTFMIILLVFPVYVFVFPVCHVAPLSNEYALACNPDPPALSVAPFTVNVTFWFVHAVGFPDTPVIVGAFISTFAV